MKRLAKWMTAVCLSFMFVPAANAGPAWAFERMIDTAGLCLESYKAYFQEYPDRFERVEGLGMPCMIKWLDIRVSHYKRAGKGYVLKASSVTKPEYRASIIHDKRHQVQLNEKVKKDKKSEAEAERKKGATLFR